MHIGHIETKHSSMKLNFSALSLCVLNGLCSGSAPIHARHLQLIFPAIFKLYNSTSLASSLHFSHAAAAHTTYLTVPQLDAPPSRAHSNLLHLCSSLKSLHQTKQTHALALVRGLIPSSASLCGALILCYATHGVCANTCRVLFEATVPYCRTAFLWNKLLRAHSILGICDGFATYNWLLRSGVLPDGYTFSSALKLCAEFAVMRKGREVHGTMTRLGFMKDLFVGKTLLLFYSKCSHLDGAGVVFEEMLQRDVVTWTTMVSAFSAQYWLLEALNLFVVMKSNSGLMPSVATVVSVLPARAGLEDEFMTRLVHGYVIRSGLANDVTVCSALIDAYAKSWNVKSSRQVFDGITERNVASWSAMVGSLAQNGNELAAMALVLEMQAQGFAPNVVTLVNLLSACARARSIRTGREVHARSIRFGFVSNPLLSNAIIDMYAKCGCLRIAHKVFDLSPKNQISYNTLIVNYSRTENSAESLNLFKEMVGNGMKRDIVSFIGAIAACTNISALKKGKAVHGLAVRSLLHSCLSVANSLLHLYTKLGRIESAQRVFDRIHEKNAASWSTMIMGFGMLGQFEKAINLFEAMKEEGLTYNSVIYIAVLYACSHGGLAEKGKRYFDEMWANGVKPSTKHFAIMIDLLGRAGLVHEAVDLIKNLSVGLDAHIWAALLGVSQIHDNIDMALWAAEHLFELSPEESGHCAQLSNMLREAGRWEEARRVRELMKSRGIKKNPGCSWVQGRDEVHTFLSGTFIDRLDSAGRPS